MTQRVSTLHFNRNIWKTETDLTGRGEFSWWLPKNIISLTICFAERIITFIYIIQKAEEWPQLNCSDQKEPQIQWVFTPVYIVNWALYFGIAAQLIGMYLAIVNDMHKINFYTLSK
jgi:hypothetical protein